MTFLEYLRREWSGFLIWAIAIWFGIEGFKALDSQSPFLLMRAVFAVGVCVLSVAAGGLAVRRALERRQTRNACR
jgi:Tfp pilus assembly protein PilN